MKFLDMLPPPAECTPSQRETAILWYTAQDIEDVSAYLRNTQMRIYQEYYAKPNKRFMGQNLVNLYQMRDMINEAIRRKHALRGIKQGR